MKRLNYQYEMKLKFSDFVREQQFQLRCIPQEDCYQKVIDTHYYIYPLDSIMKMKDGFGNFIMAGSAITRHKGFEYMVKGVVEVDYSIAYEEKCHPLYKFDTPLTRLSTQILNDQIRQLPFYEQMMAVMALIGEHMTYMPKTTNIYTTAQEAFEQGTGVCQDYAHIMIALCKQLGYPARYVAGMLLGEGETHAWVEVYHQNIWYAFDPTHNRQVNDEYIVLSKGRDYQDCIIDRGVFIGYCTQQQDVKVTVKEVTK